MKCISCKKDAEYISPEYYCIQHWMEWWFSDWDMSKEERKREIRNAIRRIRYQDRKAKRLNNLRKT